MSNKIKIAIFASGTGSNFEVLSQSAIKGHLPCEVGLLVCDKPNAPVIEKAKNLHIPTFIFSPKEYENKVSFETAIINHLKSHEINLIILAGYMRLIGTTLLQAYEGRIINIHPSFLPHFPGKDAIGQAIEAGVSETGVTVHYVDEGMDTGPIIAQQRLAIEPSDTKETLYKKIQKIEHSLYISVLKQLIEEEGIND